MSAWNFIFRTPRMSTVMAWPDVRFDLNDDRKGCYDDVEVWLGLGNSLVGDANLDGVVNFPDFLELSRNFGAEGDRVSWSSGDFVQRPGGLRRLSDTLGTIRAQLALRMPLA